MPPASGNDRPFVRNHYISRTIAFVVLCLGTKERAEFPPRPLGEKVPFGTTTVVLGFPEVLKAFNDRTGDRTPLALYCAMQGE